MMRLEVTYRNGHYHWRLFDGPDGTDECEGVASSLGCAFEQITVKRTENSRFYVPAVS